MSAKKSKKPSKKLWGALAIYVHLRSQAKKHMSQKPLEDLDPMPLGKAHRGSPMQDVPASYLHYLWSNGLSQNRGLNRDQARVREYITRNLTALKKEHKDGIW